MIPHEPLTDSYVGRVSGRVLRFLLGPRYFERLEDEIRAHIQGVDETYKEYLVELRTKMQQAVYQKEEDLCRIYENMAPEYRLYERG